jgi:hypothetical protein
MTDEQQEEDVVEGEVRALVSTQANTPIDYVPSFAITLEEAKERFKKFRQFIDDLMDEGEDYGKIPGVEKFTLLKPGAEKLCNIFGFAPHFEEIRAIEDWDKPLFYYVYRCTLTNKRTGIAEADCVGSCNSWEDRYRYRWASRLCPQCGAAAVIKGKEEYGGGWICFKKKGGCGAKFDDGDESIEGQEVGKVENEDPFSLINTIQKMAEKRALVGAVLNATRASGSFTQDVEDMPEMPPVVTKAKEPTIKIGDKEYPANKKIPQNWYERLRELTKSAGMVEPHLKNHLAKHYSVERINDLTYAQAAVFVKHLEKMAKQKPEQEEPAEESEELTEEEAAPYTIPQDILDEAAEIDFDIEEFVALHVSPDTEINEAVQGLLRKVVQGVKEGGDADALGENFNKQLAGLRK